MCFEVLGFDIMLDEQLKPLLIEVNHAPSFNTDSKLDYEIKKNVLEDTFGILYMVGPKDKRLYRKNKNAEMHKKRISKYKLSQVEKQEIMQSEVLKKDKYMQRNNGGYKAI